MSIPPEAIPLIQKRILDIAGENDREVYIATGMMTSMLDNETPTRAEINDIATAIIDGAAGVTLSEETAIGKYPLAAVKAVKNIVETVTFPDFGEMLYLQPEAELQTNYWNGILKDREYGATIKSLLKIGSMIWQRGWAEANAGNVSFKLPSSCSFMTGLNLSCIGQQLTGDVDFDFTQYDWYLVSATGSRYREFETKGFENFVLISQLRPTRENGHTYQDAPVYTFPPERKPTSEWITHHAVQLWLQQHRSEHRVIMHAHSTDWITISSLPEYTANPSQLMIDIRQCLPELDIYFPSGIALAPFATPGSDELCTVTLSALDSSNVIIWQKHGVFITATDFDAAFDCLEIVSKAAAVYLQLRK
jgi:ribulose-5-phosphate 4-epimerase/fuculose-1-phosphate aldolase